MANSLRKLILPGGSGFLGRILTQWFAGLGWEVVVLSRRPDENCSPARTVFWDGATLGPWRSELEGAAAVVNLAGRSVNCRYHARNRRRILDSRLDSTRILGQAIAACAAPPAVWLNASTATIYKHSLGQAMDEASGVIGGTPEAKDLFSVEVAQAWERAFDEAAVPATRKVALRTAMVFGTQPGTVYRILRRLARCGLGGAIAGGGQYVSWIHQTDFCRAIQWLIAHEEVHGPVNVVAPEPLTNRSLMRLMRGAAQVPFGLPSSRWMLEIGTMLLRTESELIIKSRRVVPGRLSAAGFEFEYADLRSAVSDLERRLAA